MKLGARRTLDAMSRPDAVLRLKADVICRVPIASCKNRNALPGGFGNPGVNHRNNAIPFGNGKRTAGAKVLLHVDDDQSVAALKPHKASLSGWSGWNFGADH